MYVCKSKNIKYHKVSSLITLKLSQCCSTNVGNVSKQHNQKMRWKTTAKLTVDQNQISPLNGECLTLCVIYKSISKTSYNSLVYYMERLKWSSKHGIKTMKSCSDIGTA